MSQITDGSTLTWQGTWKPTTWQWFMGSGLNGLAPELATLGLTLVDSNQLSSSISDTMQAQLVVKTTGGITYGSEDDVASLINHAVYSVSGALPESAQIVNINLAGPGGPKPLCGTGIAAWFQKLFGECQSPTVVSTSSSSSSTGIFGWLSSITSHGILTIGLVVFGFVAALALIGYSGGLMHKGE